MILVKMHYSRRLPTSLRRALPLTEERYEWAHIFEGGIPLALTLGHPSTYRKDCYSVAVEYVIREQNRAVYLKLLFSQTRLQESADYWDHEIVRLALSNLILYGMYAWITELLHVHPLSGIPNDEDLMSDAIRVRDLVIIRLLLNHGTRISRDLLRSAMNWYPCTSLFPGQMGGFGSPEEERNYLIETNQEIVDLLYRIGEPNANIDPECFIVDTNPNLFELYKN